MVLRLLLICSVALVFYGSGLNYAETEISSINTNDASELIHVTIDQDEVTTLSVGVKRKPKNRNGTKRIKNFSKASKKPITRMQLFFYNDFINATDTYYIPGNSTIAPALDTTEGFSSTIEKETLPLSFLTKQALKTEKIDSDTSKLPYLETTNYNSYERLSKNNIREPMTHLVEPSTKYQSKILDNFISSSNSYSILSSTANSALNVPTVIKTKSIRNIKAEFKSILSKLKPNEYLDKESTSFNLKAKVFGFKTHIGTQSSTIAYNESLTQTPIFMTNTNNSECYFPFIYKNNLYMKCINLDRDKHWCSVTHNYDSDRQWKYCRDDRIRTTGGNSNGTKCVFPFKYMGKYYDTCIDKEVINEDNIITYTKFCATTHDYDTDKKWGYCMDYSLCHFPFLYNNNLYTNCISTNISSSFCSTSFNFNQDKSWINCPVICSGLPEKGQRVKSFRYLNHKKPCIPKQQIHKLNGYKLRDYVNPPCQLDYSCETGYKKLYDEIECKTDGSYDKKAFCIKEA